MAERIPSRQSSTSSRSQISRRESTRLSNPNVFSDEYALESLHTNHGDRPSGFIHDAQHLAPIDTSAGVQSSRDHDSLPVSIRRSLGSRKNGYNERRASHRSRADSSRYFPPHSTRVSMESSAPAPLRSDNRASISPISRTQSPYQGATGPSHPYGMYPQDIGVLRTASTATTSTTRPRERSYTGPSGPTQPYAMYAQNTVPEDETGPVRSVQPPVPVGFPGRSQQYRRRLGPEVEDADDLVGPDGYTEQLPPYTRYPDGIPPKGAAPGPASILSAQREEQERSEDTLANPFQSQESLPQHNPRSYSSTEFTVVAQSNLPQEDEGGNFKERAKEKGKKRICWGVLPLWVIAVLVILMVAVLAGVIGAVVGHARGEQQAASTPPPDFNSPLPPAAQSTIVVVTTTSLVDATPLPSTPINLPSMPTGTFYVPLQNPLISNNSCLSQYTNAWDCVDGADLKLDLSIPGNVSVSPRYPPTANKIRFGPQPPQLDQPVPLRLVRDKDGMEKGPAWFFQQTYTKVVVIPGMDWGANAQGSRRWFDPQERDTNRKWLDSRGYDPPRGIAPPAAHPWFCYWNNTILEGFIYVTQNASENNQPTSSEYGSSSSSTGDLDSSAAASSDDGPSPFPTTTSPPPPYPAVPSPPVRRRQVQDPSQLAAYPRDVKIEERRDPNTLVQPYCVHMQIMNDWSAQPAEDSQIVMLTENEPNNEQVMAQGSSKRGKRGNLWKRTSATSACECEWIDS